jgi:hypothetical protein
MFRRFQLLLALVIPIVGLSHHALGQEPTPFKLSGVHPGFAVTNLLNATNYGLSTDRVNGMPNVGALCWLANGDLFVATQAVGNSAGNLLGPSNAYVFSGVQGNPANITMRQVASGFYLPSGCVEVNGEVYVVDNRNGIAKFTNNNTNAWTRTSIYSGLLGVMTCGGSGDRRWDAGLVHKDGYLYSSVGVGLIAGGTSESTANQCRGRGTVLRVPLAGGKADTISGGIRNSGGLNLGPEGEIFLTDNQGGWKPASPIYNARQGRWFGHPDTPFGPSGTVSGDVDPPAAIFPYGASTSSSPANNPTVARSPTDLVMLRKGVFAGQLIVGEIYLGGLYRVFLEKVRGEYQGVIFPFSQGLGTASSAGTTGFASPIRSLLLGPDDSTIYLGGGSGDGNSGNWGVANRNHWGLARMTPNGNAFFEMRAIRSLSATQMEIEFTEPITTAAASNFTVHHWNYTVGGTANNGGYGAGKNAPAQLTVTAAAVSEDRKRVTLTVNGLQQLPTNPGRNWPYVVQFQVSGVTATSGRTLWGGQAWYTLNRFGPAEAPTSVASKYDGHGVPMKLSARFSRGHLQVTLPSEAKYALRLTDTRGRLVASYSVEGKSEIQLPVSNLRPGVNLLEARSAQGNWHTVVAGIQGR